MHKIPRYLLNIDINPDFSMKMNFYHLSNRKKDSYTHEILQINPNHKKFLILALLLKKCIRILCFFRKDIV